MSQKSRASLAFSVRNTPPLLFLLAATLAAYLYVLSALVHDNPMPIVSVDICMVIVWIVVGLIVLNAVVYTEARLALFESQPAYDIPGQRTGSDS